jgi:O-antigen ligase
VAIPLAYGPGLEAPFVAPKEALLLLAGAAALGAQLLAGSSGRSSVRWTKPPALALGALVLTTALSALAAAWRGEVGAHRAASELMRQGAVVGVALGAAQAAASARWRARLAVAVHLAAGAVSLVGLLQHLLIPLPIPIISVPGATFGNRNIAAEAVAASLPFGLAALGLARRRPDGRRGRWLPLVAALVALEIAYLAVTRARGAWLGAALGLAAFVALLRPRLPRRAAQGAAAAGAAALIVAALPGRFAPRDAGDEKRFAPLAEVVRSGFDSTSPAARARIGIWRRTLRMYGERPILGVGPGNFAVLFPRYAEPCAAADGVLSPVLAPQRVHDDLLERLAETGPAGLLALLAVFAVAARQALRRARAAAGPDHQHAISAAAAASLAAVLACGLTGFPLAMPATALLFGAAFGLVCGDELVAGPPGPLPEPAAGRALRGGASLALGAALVAWAIVAGGRELAGSYLLGRAEVELRDPGPEAGARALLWLERARRAAPDDFTVALRTAHAASRLGLDSVATGAAELALQREPYSPNAWAAFGVALLHAGDDYGAAAASRRAATLLADYPGALFILAEAEARLGDGAEAARARARLAGLATVSPQARGLLRALDGRR